MLFLNQQVFLVSSLNKYTILQLYWTYLFIVSLTSWKGDRIWVDVYLKIKMFIEGYWNNKG